MAEFFEDIFKYRPRKDNKNIETFLGNLKTHPEVIAKRQTLTLTLKRLKQTKNNN